MQNVSGNVTSNEMFNDSKDTTRTISSRDVNLTFSENGVDLYLDFPNREYTNLIAAPFVGCSGGDYLIIKTPKTEGSYIPFDDSEQVVVRYLCDGKAYGFHTRAIKSIHSPMRLTFLQYPDSFEEMCLRRDTRIPLILAIKRAGQKPLDEWVLNISSSGALLRLEQEVQPSASLYISFTMPDGCAVDRLPCNVIRCQKQGDYCMVGVEFKTDHAKLPFIKSYIEKVNALSK